ncbi:MAG: hypothetical protein B6A08_13710 [Sorangiineae bacterium NIC37A_2]|nr:MAG: hypothetical protein B6A08_13710 [Sorangiineae bacterium NIC37A_2]
MAPVHHIRPSPTEPSSELAASRFAPLFEAASLDEVSVGSASRARTGSRSAFPKAKAAPQGRSGAAHT